MNRTIIKSPDNIFYKILVYLIGHHFYIPYKNDFLNVKRVTQSICKNFFYKSTQLFHCKTEYQIKNYFHKNNNLLFNHALYKQYMMAIIHLRTKIPYQIYQDLPLGIEIVTAPDVFSLKYPIFDDKNNSKKTLDIKVNVEHKAFSKTINFDIGTNFREYEAPNYVNLICLFEKYEFHKTFLEILKLYNVKNIPYVKIREVKFSEHFFETV